MFENLLLESNELPEALIMLHTEQHQHIKWITVNLALESVKFSFNLFIFKLIIEY